MTTKNKSEQKLFTKLEELKAIQERDEQGENAFVGQVQETKSSPHEEQAKQTHMTSQGSVQINPVKTASGGNQPGITFEKVKTVTTSSLPKKKNTVKTKGEECADCILVAGLWVKRQCAM